jgi:hypothetical protein
MTRVHGSCLECGGPRETKRRAQFCCSACRVAWTNRRKMRGAEFYDLWMAIRFEREEAAALGLMQAMNRLASICRQEDHVQRASRQSWRPPREVILDRPSLKAKISTMRIGRAA